MSRATDNTSGPAAFYPWGQTGPELPRLRPGTVGGAARWPLALCFLGPPETAGAGAQSIERCLLLPRPLLRSRLSKIKCKIIAGERRAARVETPISNRAGFPFSAERI